MVEGTTFNLVFAPNPLVILSEAKDLDLSNG